MPEDIVALKGLASGTIHFNASPKHFTRPSYKLKISGNSICESSVIIEDLENIAEYIAKDSKKYAVIQILRIRNHVKTLKKQPQIGRIVPELNDQNVQELILGNYRIIYEIISKERIDILTVHHSAKLIKPESFDI